MTYATYRKYNVLHSHMTNMTVREKRTLFIYLRTCKTDDVFFPQQGFTAGCFCVWQVLNDCRRPRKTKTKTAGNISFRSEM